MKGSARAGFVFAAPAKAEDRLGRVCERTICGWIEFDFFNQILIKLSIELGFKAIKIIKKILTKRKLAFIIKLKTC
jgi:hypothetical protein